MYSAHGFVLSEREEILETEKEHSSAVPSLFVQLAFGSMPPRRIEVKYLQFENKNAFVVPIKLSEVR